MAVTRREQQILDLVDDGLGDAAISERLAISLAYVRQIRSELWGNPAGDRAREAAIRQGSQLLGRAIAAAGYFA